MAALAANVVIAHPETGDIHVFEAGETPFEWAARLMGAHCFENGEHPYPPEVDEPAEREPGAIPPKKGTGSGRDSWATYAGEVRVEIQSGLGRDEIIAAIKDAGKPVEYQD